MGLLSLKTDATPVGKRNFLRYYYKARSDSLTAKNIKAGWRASGLWPTNSAKPLLSRLLLENSNKLEDQSSKRKADDVPLDWNEDQSFWRVKTPTKLDNLRDEVHQISQLGKASAPTARVLFRKISKAWDKRDFVIAQHEQRIKQLEARVADLKPKKRRKVIPSPNSKFVDIQAIYKAQKEAGDRDTDVEVSSSIYVLSSTLSHITVN